MPATRIRSILPATLALLSCIAPAHSGEPAERGPVFVDASAYLRAEADIEAWFMLRRQLARNFDDICGIPSAKASTPTSRRCATCVRCSA